MSAKPIVLPTPPANPKGDWTAAEKTFFEKHGITDDKEKEVIRKRALVAAYDRERSKFEKEEKEPEPDKPRAWYQDPD